jgi:hypothetical protein
MYNIYVENNLRSHSHPHTSQRSKDLQTPDMVSPTSSSRKRQLSTTPANNDDTAADAGEYLLDRLRILLSRLQTTAEILQNWPETSSAQQGNDSAKVHAETSTELVASIRKIALGIRSIERHVNGTAGGGGGGGGTGSSSTAAA